MTDTPESPTVRCAVADETANWACDAPDEEFHLTVTTGVLYHFYTWTLTRRVGVLTDYVGGSFVEIHRETATGLGVTDGEYVQTESRRSAIGVQARVTDPPDRGSSSSQHTLPPAPQTS